VVTIPHMMVGMAVAKLSRRPALGLPLAFLSHFALDAIPHTNFPGLAGRSPSGVPMWEVFAVLMEVELALLLVLALAMRRHDRRLLVGGAIVAFLPDLVELLPVVGPQLATWPGTAWYVHLHHGVQRVLPPPPTFVGVLTQVVVTVAAIWTIRHHWRKTTRRTSAASPHRAHVPGSALPRSVANRALSGARSDRSSHRHPDRL
jgi:hypothetical protein